MTTVPPPTGGSSADAQEVADAVRPTGAEPVPPARGARSARVRLNEFWRRYRRNRLAVVGLGILALLVFAAVFEPVITPYDPREQNLLNTTAPPSAAHILGTDVLGRDMYSAIIYGARLAVIVGVATMLMSLLVGVALGAVAGYRGGAADAAIMRTTDVFLAFPLLVGAILVVRTFGAGVTPVVIALVVFSWPTAGRLMRGQALSLRGAEYVEAARSIGAGDGRIIRRHILPNAIVPVLVYSFTSIGTVIVAMASLSFLGVGVPADVPEWGRLISQSYQFIRVPGKTHLWLFPSLALVITALGFAFVADGLRDALDPRLRGRD